MVCRILVPWPGIEPTPSAVKTQSPNHWTTRKFPTIPCFYSVTWSEVKSLSRVRLFVTPWTVAYQAPPSMGFSRQEYWSGVPFPSPGDLPNSGIEPWSPTWQANALTWEPPGKPYSVALLVKSSKPGWFWCTPSCRIRAPAVRSCLFWWPHYSSILCLQLIVCWNFFSSNFDQNHTALEYSL